ncbi:transglycosylase SLT domain-containing protein (plasmid) [Edwardsiella tarda]|uniref:transglycosylase SLT domain-containing protein n=1 Tax=Edwardsiella tarda TaxID=636 RepID=UPI000D50E9E6|nr:transglycosylase SLT domain-containing protein [Edwardsiella tarda]UCQ29553.1 transglycosylase SLT domain-containing protein [Edwardsiella tarda]
MRRLLPSMLLLTLSLPANSADCFELAARDYQLDPDLLRAIAFRESSFQPTAMNITDEQRYAVGLMQIHSQNFTELSRYGITPQQLYRDPCMNIYTGAYYLAISIKKMGAVWTGVGGYNAGFAKTPQQAYRREQYAKSVAKIYHHIKAQKPPITP